MVHPVVMLGCRWRFKPIWLRPGWLLQSMKLAKLVVLLRGSPIRWLGVQWVGTLLKGMWEWSALLEASESVVNLVWAKSSCTGGGTGGGGELNSKNQLTTPFSAILLYLFTSPWCPLIWFHPLHVWGCFRTTIHGVCSVFGATDEAYIWILGFISMHRCSIWHDLVWTQVMFCCTGFLGHILVRRCVWTHLSRFRVV
jgi:hypothetical protein